MLEGKFTQNELLTRARNIQWYQKLDLIAFEQQMLQYREKVRECRKKRGMIYDNDDLNSDVLGHTRKKLSEDLEQLVKSDPTYPINHDVNEPEWMNFLTEADRAKLRMDAVLGNYPNHLLPRLIQFLGKVGAVCVILPTYILYRYDAIPWILTPLPTIAILWTTYQDNVRYQQNHRDNVIRYLQEPIESLLEAPFLCKYSGIGGRAQASKQSFREKHAALLQTGEEFRGLE